MSLEHPALTKEGSTENIHDTLVGVLGHRSQLRELPVVKVGQFEQQPKQVVLDFNPKH